MLQEVGDTTGQGSKLVVPHQVPQLWDNNAAYALVEKLRWSGEKNCPRCNSLYTKAVNTSIFRELYRCIDCGYMFNTISGTIFQGAKIPLTKFFQLFVLYAATDSQISPRELSFVIDVSHKTSNSLLTRVGAIELPTDFAICDADLRLSIADKRPSDPAIEANRNFFDYCDMRAICVNADLLVEFVQGVVKMISPSERRSR